MFDDNEEELSCDEETDDGFDEDMQALTRACTITGIDINDRKDVFDGGTNVYSPSPEDCTYQDSSGGEEDDLELFRKVQSRFSKSDHSSEPIALKALRAIHPDVDDEDDDFQTLCAVRRRFSAYDASDCAKRTMEKTSLENPENADWGLDVLNGSSTVRKNNKVFPDTEDTLLSDDMDIVPSSSIEQLQLDTFGSTSLGKPGSSFFPKSAQLFLDAIKKNRLCQKFLQSKMVHIEARMEENKKLKERVKILKDFQAKCRTSTSRALGLEKHQYVRLISAQKTENCRDVEANDKKTSAMCYGPVENSHVTKYREALRNYPVLFKQKNWTDEERENLKKGIRQQFQEMVLQHSLDQFSSSEWSANAIDLDSILASIRDIEITPERCREFLPKVNWDQLASLYVPGHTAAECEARWLNMEDPLINHGEWTVEEDKKLLFIVQEKGMANWFDIAVLHGKNRTPFQCLARFQRSLNARIIKREWTKEEDDQLRIAVETFGDNDWQSVASALEGRTGPQCSNRWHKSLHPDISRVGRWTPEESIRLKVAVMLFSSKNWRKIAQFVPGRTHVKCRERWFNCEDPSLKRDKWTEDEDLKLEEAIQEHGYCWAKVAKCLAPRTDNQCRRRWMALFPQEVPLLQAVRRTQKAAIISNFVDRECDRPTLGPHDFVQQPLIQSASGPEDKNQSRKSQRKARKGMALEKNKNDAPNNTSKRRQSKRLKERTVQDPRESDCNDAEDSGENDTAVSIRTNSPGEDEQENLLSDLCIPRKTSRNSLGGRKRKQNPVTRKSGEDVTKRRRKPISRMDSPANCEKDGPLSNSILGSASKSIIVYTRRRKKLPVYQNEIETQADEHDSVGQFDGSSKMTKIPFRRKVDMKSAEPTDASNCDAKRVQGPNDEYDATLAPFLHNRSHKSTCQVSEDDELAYLHSMVDDEYKKVETFDSSDECDGTLASFLQDKARCRVDKRAHVVHKGEVEGYCDNGLPEKENGIADANDPCGGDNREDDGEGMRGLDGGFEITLATFLNHKKHVRKKVQF